MYKLSAGFLVILYGKAFGQSPDAPAKPEPKFEVAGIRQSPNVRNPYFRTTPPRGGRYELKNGTIVDLVRVAYDMNNDRILGGPSWLELDRFDVVAKLPAETPTEERRRMLQTLLRDRFKLLVHSETKPVPTYTLTAGKKPALKESDGTGESGCKPEQASGSQSDGGIRINGQNISLGPGMSIHMACRNMTMSAFAGSIRGMFGAPDLGSSPVLDETGLKGNWNFDLRYSLQFFGPMPGSDGERVSMITAIEKLGLKLEQKLVPAEVLVVDSVNRQPTPDTPDVAAALPPIPVPTEFEVADIKQTDPGFRGSRSNTQGGRFTAQGMPLRFLVQRAFNSNMGNRDEIAGLPPFADTERFDITAKVPSAGGQSPAMDFESTSVMIRALLVDRFKLAYHTEQRQVPAYSLVAPKPKLAKADPNTRSSCKQTNNAPGAPAGSVVLTCKNVTMGYFAEHLQNFAYGSIGWPVEDATELTGGFDFSLSFSPYAGMNFGGPRPTGAGEANVPTASDPGGMMTVFEAIQKLGLKLEQRKRSMPVIVIDHIEQKPTEN